MSPLDIATLDAFEAANDWLLSLITDPEGKRYFVDRSPVERLAELKEQLARTAEFLEFAGNPQKAFRGIHIAGTSGKGSVTVMIAAILQSAGISHGHHISPYLQVVNEKLSANGRLIAPQGFAAQVAQLRHTHQDWLANGNPPLKYGEAWVALTYQFLAAAGVEWAAIETGLGGRYDPTNAMDGEVAVITNIDLDHQHILGNTLDEIAGHKAGIIKTGVFAITGERKPGPLAVIEREAKEKNAGLYRLGEEFDFQTTKTAILIEGPYNRYEGLEIGLAGEFQSRNAAVAVAALDVLREHRGLQVSADSVRNGLAGVQFAGRMEVMQSHPLVILDGAHNQAKMSALVASLTEMYPGRKARIVLGTLATKDAEAMVAALVPVARDWVLTAPVVYGKPALPPNQLAELVRSQHPNVSNQTIEGPMKALSTALSDLELDDMLVIAGSIYLIGELRGNWVPEDALLESLAEEGWGGQLGLA
jgi:dihydrofolate synthase/folylpolyglutamate synthase